MNTDFTSNTSADLPLRMRACATKPRYVGETRDLFIEGAAEIEAADARYDKVEAERDRLQAALVKHGAHAAGCSNQRNVGDCSCGLWAALSGEPAPKRAYYETHEPPHCPTCGCGSAHETAAELWKRQADFASERELAALRQLARTPGLIEALETIAIHPTQREERTLGMSWTELASRNAKIARDALDSYRLQESSEKAGADVSAIELLREELEIEKARVQDLCAMILNGRETREDEPVRTVTSARFMKALAKARKHFAPNGVPPQLQLENDHEQETLAP